MKAAVVILLMLVSGTMAGFSVHSISPLSVKTKTVAPRARGSVGLDLCPLCVNFMGQAINELLNIILNAGVVGGCGELCALLNQEIPSEILNVVCNLLCDVVGIREFIKAIEEADLDPIYYCELVDMCPIKDNGDAHIISLTVSPNTVVHGSQFQIECVFETKNGTGTGEFDVEILTADGIPLGDALLLNNLDPGTYNTTLKVEAKPDPNCDPTQEPCEEWIPGNYTVEVAICEGECFSKHPHSRVYDQAKATFNVVEKN